MKKFSYYFFIIALIGITSACNDDDDETITDPQDPNAGLKSNIKETYADVVYGSYQDAMETAEELDIELDAFVANPSDQALEEAKQAWLVAREYYGPTEAYRFSEGPIDAEDGPEGLLNAWPLDENYIDYVDGLPDAGIINDLTTYPTLNAALLESLNEENGETNISIGYHAVEFLLWGQDNSDASLQTAGIRPFTDFVAGGTASNQERRAQYLQISMELLIGHLQVMIDAWAPNTSGNYREEFLATSNDVVIRNILTGIGILSKSELAGERMVTPLANQNQEDEHSCFSDNTHRDIVLNADGIRNVYTGSYMLRSGVMIEGGSIQELIGIVNNEVRLEMDALSELTISTTNDISAPFDFALTQETLGGDGEIMTAVRALQDQGDKIAEMAAALGFTISTELPE